MDILNGEDTVTLDPTIVDAIDDLRISIESTGVVSKNDILSIEKLAGSEIITNTLNINGFTSIASGVGAPAVIDKLKKVTADLQVVKDISTDRLAIVTKECMSSLINLRNTITRLMNIPQERKELFTDKSKIMVYLDRDDESVTNLLDQPIATIPLHIRNYSELVFNRYLVDNFHSALNNTNSNADSAIFKTLNALDNNKLDMYSFNKTMFETYTQRKLIEGIFSGKYLEIVNESLASCAVFGKSLYTYYYDDDMDTLAKDIKRMEMYHTYIDDGISIPLLELYASEVNR